MSTDHHIKHVTCLRAQWAYTICNYRVNTTALLARVYRFISRGLFLRFENRTQAHRTLATVIHFWRALTMTTCERCDWYLGYCQPYHTKSPTVYPRLDHYLPARVSSFSRAYLCRFFLYSFHLKTERNSGFVLFSLKQWRMIKNTGLLIASIFQGIQNLKRKYIPILNHGSGAEE